MKQVIFILLFSNLLISQTKIPAPSNKSELYNDHALYYEEWLKKINNFNHIVFNPDTFSTHELNTTYYNRFNTYYKMMPDVSSDILYIFFDAITFDKDNFCRSYNDIIRPKESHVWTIEYYEQEKFFMDKVCSAIFKSYNKELISELESMRERDQRFREDDNFDFEKQSNLDSLNQIKFREIIDLYGYPNREIVGIKYEEYLVYILLHSSLEMMEEFFPLIKENVDKGKLRKYHLAYLIDRIKMLNGEPQIYGTQKIVNKKGNDELYEVIDPKNLNSRRESFDLWPIEN